ncbi:MAG TPA: hypothetical protein HPP87_11820, partial [Planctomycetes bacterium]|nr:hypothetical protein [Planctomycetota bacterium]
MYDAAIDKYNNRARYYDPPTGRFITSDPYPGDTQDPLSRHRYLYCYGNPINAIDPSGELPSFTAVGQLVARSIESTIRNIQGVYFTTVAPRLYFNLYRAFMLYQWAMYQMPRVYLALGAIDVSLTILDNMATTWLNNTQTIPAGNFDRGMMLHNMTGSNLGRTFPTIDHFENGVAVSIKTHSRATQSSFFTAVRSDLRSMVGIENIRLTGRSAGGFPIRIEPGDIQTKCLLVAIPQTQSRWLFMESFRNSIRQLQTQYRTTIKVVPVKGWKK